MSSCFAFSNPKVQYASEAEARERRDYLANRFEAKALGVFHCDECSSWHVGTPQVATEEAPEVDPLEYIKIKVAEAKREQIAAREAQQ